MTILSIGCSLKHKQLLFTKTVSSNFSAYMTYNLGSILCVVSSTGGMCYMGWSLMQHHSFIASPTRLDLKST